MCTYPYLNAQARPKIHFFNIMSGTDSNLVYTAPYFTGFIGISTHYYTVIDTLYVRRTAITKELRIVRMRSGIYKHCSAVERDFPISKINKKSDSWNKSSMDSKNTLYLSCQSSAEEFYTMIQMT